MEKSEAIQLPFTKEQLELLFDDADEANRSIYAKLDPNIRWGLACERKAWKYFQDVVRTDYYLDALRALRKKYAIVWRGNELWPKGAKSYDPANFVKLRAEIADGLCRKFALSNTFIILIEDDLFGVPDFDTLQKDIGLCSVVERDEALATNAEDANDARAYPINLKISPYATKRDIIEMVTKGYKYHIKPLQDKHRRKDIGVGRKKSAMSNFFEQSDSDDISDRNDFIYRHRDWPLKKIRTELAALYAFRKKPSIFILDDGHIGKVISLEKKKRTKV